MDSGIKVINTKNVNCYLLKKGKDYILIDTGFPEMQSEIENEIADAGCLPGNLKLIILTHGHIDHAGNALYLKKKFKTEIAIHKADSEIVEKNGFEDLSGKVEYRNALSKIFMKIFWALIKQGIKKMYDGYKPFKPDLIFDENFKLDVYGFDGQIIHLPGHSKGSIGILTKGGCLFCGDALANMKKPGTMPFAENIKMLDDSAKKIKNLEIKMIYPGHGRPFKPDELL